MRPEIIALRFAVDYGWYTFPISKGSKDPLKGVSWKNTLSTCDAEKIKQYALRYPGHNWGLDCGKSGLVILDVDDPGWTPVGPLPETLTVATPRGGRHYYYKGEGINTAGAIAPKIDTRGRGGFVVLPGSIVNGKRYEIIGNTVTVASAPSWLFRFASKPPPEQHEIIGFEWDLPHNLERADNWLLFEAPEGVEGSRNDTIYRVTCQLRDYGVSALSAMSLMTRWNENNCRPPVSGEELEKAVYSAYKTAQSAPGSKTPEVLFNEPPKTGFLRLAGDIDWNNFKPRPWVMHNRYMRGTVTVLAAPGGAGKSLLSILDAIAVATGQPLSGEKVEGPSPVWIINAEDDAEEIERRIVACASANGLIREDLEGCPFYYASGYGKDLNIVVQKGKDLEVNEKFVGYLIKTCIEKNIALLIIDPMINFYEGNESDNSEIKRVMRVLLRVAEEANCAVCMVHHLVKGKMSQPGDASSIRGASAIVNAARLAATLTTMRPADAKFYGIPLDACWQYKRLDTAKVNFAAARGRPTWFVNQSIALIYDNEETTGALKFIELHEVRSEDVAEMVDSLLDYPLEKDYAPLIAEVIPYLIDIGKTSSNGGVDIGSFLREILASFKLGEVIGTDAIGYNRSIEKRRHTYILARSIEKEVGDE